MARASWQLLNLPVAAFETLPLVELSKNLLEHPQLAINGMGAHPGDPLVLIHPEVDDLDLVDRLIAKETVQRPQRIAVRIRGVWLDVAFVVLKPRRRCRREGGNPTSRSVLHAAPPASSRFTSSSTQYDAREIRKSAFGLPVSKTKSWAS